MFSYRESQYKTIYVGGLQQDFTTREIEKIFLKYGQIEGVRKPKGVNFAFVQFRNAESAQVAVKNGHSSFPKGTVSIEFSHRGPKIFDPRRKSTTLSRAAALKRAAVRHKNERIRKAEKRRSPILLYRRGQRSPSVIRGKVKRSPSSTVSRRRSSTEPSLSKSADNKISRYSKLSQDRKNSKEDRSPSRSPRMSISESYSAERSRSRSLSSSESPVRRSTLPPARSYTSSRYSISLSPDHPRMPETPPSPAPSSRPSSSPLPVRRNSSDNYRRSPFRGASRSPSREPLKNKKHRSRRVLRKKSDRGLKSPLRGVITSPLKRRRKKRLLPRLRAKFKPVPLMTMKVAPPVKSLLDIDVGRRPPSPRRPRSPRPLLTSRRRRSLSRTPSPHKYPISVNRRSPSPPSLYSCGGYRGGLFYRLQGVSKSNGSHSSSTGPKPTTMYSISSSLQYDGRMASSRSSGMPSRSSHSSASYRGRSPNRRSPSPIPKGKYRDSPRLIGSDASRRGSAVKRNRIKSPTRSSHCDRDADRPSRHRNNSRISLSNQEARFRSAGAQRSKSPNLDKSRVDIHQRNRSPKPRRQDFTPVGSSSSRHDHTERRQRSISPREIPRKKRQHSNRTNPRRRNEQSRSCSRDRKKYSRTEAKI